MALLTQHDLQYQYSWTALGDDDPKITGVPDSTLLNRQEGYEVLAFINRIAARSNWTTKAYGLKAERLIRNDVPGHLRSHAHIWQWLADNWNNY
jgi:hypothetical protein